MRFGRRTSILLGLTVVAAAALLYTWLGDNNEALGQGSRHWSIEFIPRQAESVSIIVDGKVWNPRRSECGPTWERREGRVHWHLPVDFARHERMRIVAVSHPWGAEAEVIVRHNGIDRRKMLFNRIEETEILR